MFRMAARTVRLCLTPTRYTRCDDEGTHALRTGISAVVRFGREVDEAADPSGGGVATVLQAACQTPFGGHVWACCRQAISGHRSDPTGGEDSWVASGVLGGGNERPPRPRMPAVEIAPDIASRLSPTTAAVKSRNA